MPSVSTATGAIEYVCKSTEYFVLLRASAPNTAAPAEIEVFRMYEGAKNKLSGLVKSQTGRLFVHGKCAAPLGRFPSPLFNSGGSKIDGKLTRQNAPVMMSFAAW